jgi:hypothetical protein
MQTAAIYGASNLINYTEGSDYFNLLLTKASPNQQRSNNPLGIVVTQTYAYGLCKYGSDNTGNHVFEPQPNRKGDAARAMMYEMICYNGLSGSWALDSLLSQANQQDQNILKLWNQQDPPDKFERTKNAYINSIQHNRNPFIDHPQWATCINFDNLAKTNLCNATGVEQIFPDAEIRLFPNPSSQVINLEIQSIEFREVKIDLFDIYGRIIYKSKIDEPNTTLNVSSLEAGNYFLRISVDKVSDVKKIVIER